MVNPKNLDAERCAILDSAEVVHDRIHALASLGVGKRVLNVGCAGAKPQGRLTEDALYRHIRIARASASCLGVDLDRQGVAELEHRGYKAVVADASTCQLGMRFEVIVAGEVIEHLPNPDTFLRNMARHLQPNGTLALSTPNPFCTLWTWKILKYGHSCVHPEHTCWYDPVTLMEMSRRCGLAPQQLIWVQEERGFDFRLLPRILRRHFSDGFILLLKAATTAA